MTKQEIISFVSNPSLVLENETEKLFHLKQEFPYCHSFHLLHLKGLKNTNNIEFDKYLSTTSLNAPNREVLYHLIIKTPLREKIETVAQEISESIKEDSVQTLEQPLNVEAKDTTEEEKQTQQHVVDEVEHLILEEMASQHYILEDDVEEEIEPETDVHQEDISTSEMSFTDWLNPQGKSQKHASSMDLIEKFIQENPSISKAKADAYTAPSLAKMSVVDNDDLVTETLARVYMKQGHYDKAIKTYQKLSLKIPEKKAFFASQIEVIEELKKQK
jgi:tetratricopeptide (TPR) repeat protein